MSESNDPQAQPSDDWLQISLRSTLGAYRQLAGLAQSLAVASAAQESIRRIAIQNLEPLVAAHESAQKSLEPLVAAYESAQKSLEPLVAAYESAQGLVRDLVISLPKLNLSNPLAVVNSSVFAEAKHLTKSLHIAIPSIDFDPTEVAVLRAELDLTRNTARLEPATDEGPLPNEGVEEVLRELVEEVRSQTERAVPRERRAFVLHVIGLIIALLTWLQSCTKTPPVIQPVIRIERPPSPLFPLPILPSFHSHADEAGS
jgi:hypothetical protein